MNLITKVVDFTGKYELHKGAYTTNKLQAYIDKYEPRYLKELFGITLYNEFYSDLILVNGEYIPQSPNFQVLFNPFAEDVFQYRMLISDGIKEMLLGFIYYEYAKDLYNTQSVYGAVQQTSELSNPVSTLSSLMYTRYNESVRTFNTIRDYIILHWNDMPIGQIISIQLEQNNIGYYSGQRNIYIVNGWVQLATIDMQGTGYQVGDEYFVGNTGWKIEVTQVGGLGELQDFDVLHGGYGYNVGSIYQLGSGTGTGAQLEVQQVGNSQGVLTGNPKIQIYAETIGEVVSGNLVQVGTGGYVDATDVPVFGGSGNGLLLDISADPNTGQVTGVQIGSSGGYGYQPNDIVNINLGNNDAQFGVAVVKEGLITSHNMNPFNTALSSGFVYGDRVRVSGNGNNPDAVFEVVYTGIGDITQYNGKEKLTAYWI